MVGDTISYTIKLKGVNVVGLSIKDKLPANVEYIDGSCNVDCEYKDGKLYFEDVEALDGDMTITYKAKATKAGDAINTVLADYENNINEPAKATAKVEVVKPATQKEEKSGGSSTRSVAQTGDYVMMFAFAAFIIACVSLAFVAYRRSRKEREK